MALLYIYLKVSNGNLKWPFKCHQKPAIMPSPQMFKLQGESVMWENGIEEKTTTTKQR